MHSIDFIRERFFDPSVRILILLYGKVFCGNVLRQPHSVDGEEESVTVGMHRCGIHGIDHRLAVPLSDFPRGISIARQMHIQP